MVFVCEMVVLNRFSSRKTDHLAYEDECAKPPFIWQHRSVTQSDLPDAVRESRVATAAWWEDHGLTRRRMRTLTRSGDMVRTRYGIYATKAAMEKAAMTPRLGHALEVGSAMLAVDHGTVASHQSAAILHGIDLLRAPPKGQVALTRDKARNHSALQGIVFHTGDLPKDHITKWQYIPVTTIPRTVVDLARALPFMEGVVVADAALRTRELVTFEFEPVLEACVHWPGLERAREVVKFSDPNAGSVFESCLRVFLRDWGFAPPETQVTILAGGSAFDVDFLYREHRTIIEADGLLKYNEARDLRKQFERDRVLRDAGYKVIHVTWDEVFRHSQIVIDRIKTAFKAINPF
jgi:very-short-patch-repair endonuclease